jgi:DNA-binding NtrC family response regulator
MVKLGSSPSCNGCGESRDQLGHMSRILVVDDEPSVISLLQRMLSSEGHEVTPASSGEGALQAIESFPPDLIIVDVRLGGLSGLEAVRCIKLVAPRVPVILVTGFGSTATAIEAIKLGAYDYVTKPLDLSRFRELVSKALANGSPITSPATAESEYGALEVELLGTAPAMCEVYKLVGRIAPCSVTVLIQGESGTGKELLARTIHRHSQRLAKPFVTVNSAAIPETLLESELFGYEKGAFTGAARRTAGKFEQAHLGTLFLDEIGDLSAPAQAKVLRVLEERTFERLGGSEPVCVDVRVLAATNRDLEELVHQGSFREDLYHRLNVIRITLPALRDRKQDIPQLAAHFVQKHGAALGKDGVLL